LIKLTEEQKLRIGLSLRQMMMESYLAELLKGSEDKLTPTEEALFKLGFRKGVEYMDVRTPLIQKKGGIQCPQQRKKTK